MAKSPERALMIASGDAALKAAVQGAMIGYLKAMFECAEAQPILAKMLTLHGWTCTPPRLTQAQRGAMQELAKRELARRKAGRKERT